jgi:hypothetical protein
VLEQQEVTSNELPKKEPLLSPPAYGSQTYFDMAKAVEESILQVAEQLRSTAIDTATAISSLAEGLVSIQKHHYVPRNVPGAKVRRVRPPATRSSHRRSPTERFRRMANGLRVPPAVQKLLKKRRKLVSEAPSAKAQLERKRESMDVEEAAEADRCVKDMIKETKQLRQQAQRLINSSSKEQYKNEANRLSHMLRRHPSKFYRVMQQKIPQPFEVSSGHSKSPCCSKSNGRSKSPCRSNFQVPWPFEVSSGHS